MAGLLKKRIRTALKYAAYRGFALLHHLKRMQRIDSSYALHAVEDAGRETFFGYYDKFPENGKGIVLFHSALKTSVHPAKQHSVDIVAAGPGSEKRLSTRAFNWQQGGRLQWINDSEFIFNDYDPAGKRYICRRCSIDNDSERTYLWPVQDSFKDEYMISIDYHVLSRYASDYGYFCGTDVMSEQPAVIRKVDFAAGKDQVLVKAEEVIALLGLKKNKVFHYYFNHGMISPDGSKFIFMFRYSDGRKYRNDSLLLYDLGSGGTTVLVRESMVSHCCWLDNGEVMAFMEYDGKKSYFKITVKTASVHEMFSGRSFRDGHPSFEGGKYITDTYPDKYMMQTLMELERNGSKKKIASFYHPPKYFGLCRCDLHPKVKGGKIYLDTVAGGKRKLCRVDYD